MTSKTSEISTKIETELKLEGKSKHTVQMYCYYNLDFIDYCKKQPPEVTQEDVKLYLAHLLSHKNCSAKTVSLARSALRYYYNNLMKVNLINEDIKTPKLHKKLPDVPTKNDIKKLLAEAKSFRTKLFVELLYSSGLRVSECAGLEWGNLNFQEKTGLIRSGKGNKDRFFILSSIVIKDLIEYKKSVESKFVFPGEEGPISTRTIQREITKLTGLAGINKKIYCHLLRHAFGTHLAESGTDIRMIQELMGHENIQTTQIYTTLSRNVLKSVISPLDNL